MSVIRTNNITNKDGTSGPTISGISTVSSSGFMRVPVGDTRTRLVRDYENIVTNGLVLHLDAGRAASYGDDGTTWRDLSGQNNNGTLQGGVGFTVDDGGSLIFDGVNDYVSKSSCTNPPTNNFTIGCWVRFSDNVTDRYVLSFGRDVGGVTGGLALFAYGFDAVLSNVLFFECGSAIGRVSSGIVPTLNIWYYLTVTADGTNTKFYLNGDLKNTSSQGSGAIASSPTLSIGSYVSSGGTPGTYFHSGNIAQISIYNRALSASEVQQNFNALRNRYGI